MSGENPSPYLSAAEVLASVKSLSSSGLSAEVLNPFIADETCIVEGILRQRYRLPIEADNSAAIGIIKAIVRYRVLVRLELYLKIQSTGKKGSQEVLDASKYYKMAEAELKKIMEGSLQLPNVERVSDLVSYDFPEKNFPDGRAYW